MSAIRDGPGIVSPAGVRRCRVEKLLRPKSEKRRKKRRVATSDGWVNGMRGERWSGQSRIAAWSIQHARVHSILLLVHRRHEVILIRRVLRFTIRLSLIAVLE